MDDHVRLAHTAMKSDGYRSWSRPSSWRPRRTTRDWACRCAACSLIRLRNGKSERFIQSALREWAYGHVYSHSEQRQALA